SSASPIASCCRAAGAPPRSRPSARATPTAWPPTACASRSSGSTFTTSGSTTRRAMPDPASWRSRVAHRRVALLPPDLLRHQGDEPRCRVVIDEQELFRDDDGSVPAWVGLEYMAQCIAVHAAMVSESEGPPPLGFLVSARGLRFHCARFEPGQRLEA